MHKNDIKKLNQLGGSQTPFFFIVNYDASEVLTFNEDEMKEQMILFSWPEKSNASEQQLSATQALEIKKTVSFNDYQKIFTKLLIELNSGNSYLTNLTFSHQLQDGLNLTELFYQTAAKYKLLLPQQFLCFSPETFLKTEKDTISTFPMKGTSREAMKDQLIGNPKEKAEQATIVDLLRNDLSLISSQVKLENFRYSEMISSGEGQTFIQTSSKISGHLQTGWQNQLGDMLNQILPAGSVTGAPKKKTVEIINQLEDHQRGFYTGIAGYFDGKDLDTCVLIRFIEQNSGQFYFKSGGGITAESDAKNEYQEMLEKVYLPVS